MRIGITERGDASNHLPYLKSLMAEKSHEGYILITKHPSALVDQDFPPNVVIHCTITGHGGTVIEPGVKPWQEELPAAKKLLDRYGSERVILRIDPILWPMFDSGLGTEHSPSLRVAAAGRELGFLRLRISFIDAYPHVLKRFRNAGILNANGDPSFHMHLDWRSRMWDLLGKPEVCGEPGLPCYGCVSLRDILAMGLDIKDASGQKGRQRWSCTCIAEKTELLKTRGQCPSKCLYCYWK